MITSLTTVSEADAEAVLRTLKTMTGITIPIAKKLMVMHRLQKRVAELGDRNTVEYLARLKREPREHQTFVNLLTTNETSFFRTARVWEYFRKHFLPACSAKGSPTPVRIWSAASSSGEEPYSIAMACLDHQARFPAFQFHITASDIDTNVLEEARAGIYPALKVDKLRVIEPVLALKHFLPHADGYLATPQLRRLVEFRRHNLMEAYRTTPPIDIVFLRNVLIYFEEAEQTRILRHIASSMVPGGILLLGESESISRLDSPFTFVQPLVYRKAG